MKCPTVYGLVLCLSLSSCVAPGEGTDYWIEILNERIFSVCEEHPDNFLSKAFDLSNLSFMYGEDEKIHVNGSFEFTEDIPLSQTITANVEVLRKKRGQWVSTVYSLHRNNLCDALYSPVEIWYNYSKVIPEGLRDCPPAKGTVFEFETAVSPELKNFQDRNADGEYKIHLILNYGPEPDKFLCFDIILNLARM